MVILVTDIAHLMGLKVVAEFVQDANTAEILKKIGVDFIQGHHVGQPSLLVDLF